MVRNVYFGGLVDNVMVAFFRRGNVVCSQGNLNKVLKCLLEVNGWKFFTSSGRTNVRGLRSLDNYCDYLSDCVSTDLTARKDFEGLILEVKSLLYARLKRLRRLEEA